MYNLSCNRLKNYIINENNNKDNMIPIKNDTYDSLFKSEKRNNDLSTIFLFNPDNYNNKEIKIS